MIPVPVPVQLQNGYHVAPPSENTSRIEDYLPTNDDHSKPSGAASKYIKGTADNDNCVRAVDVLPVSVPSSAPSTEHLKHWKDDLKLDLRRLGTDGNRDNGNDGADDNDQVCYRNPIESHNNRDEAHDLSTAAENDLEDVRQQLQQQKIQNGHQVSGVVPALCSKEPDLVIQDITNNDEAVAHRQSRGNGSRFIKKKSSSFKDGMCRQRVTRHGATALPMPPDGASEGGTPHPRVDVPSREWHGGRNSTYTVSFDAGSWQQQQQQQRQQRNSKNYHQSHGQPSQGAAQQLHHGSPQAERRASNSKVCEICQLCQTGQREG